MSLPMPFSVKIVNDQYYILLNLNSMLEMQFPYWKQQVIYQCNDEEESGILLETTKKSPATLIVQCPATLDASRERLKTLSIFPMVVENDNTSTTNTNISSTSSTSASTNARNTSGMTNPSGAIVTYNMTIFLECEKHDITMHQHLQESSTHPSNSDNQTKVGITATLTGSRKMILEWAAYHHLIGFDHVWIYINDHWKDGQDLPHREYITWIPWNYNVKYYNMTLEKKYCAFHEIFRPASQNDALWRARRLGYDWMSFPDLDEFVFVGNNPQESFHDNNNTSSSTAVETSRPLKRYLKEYQKIHGHLLYDGIMLRSVPFGRNVELDRINAANKTLTASTDISAADNNHRDDNHDTDELYKHSTEMVLDYTWRQNANLSEWGASRNKLLVKVDAVSTVNIHYIG
jgi:hypothetical protein